MLGRALRARVSLLLLTLMSITALSGCQSGAASPPVGATASLPNPPAIVEPSVTPVPGITAGTTPVILEATATLVLTSQDTATPVLAPFTSTTASFLSPGTSSMSPTQTALPNSGDPSTWPLIESSVEGVKYSYRMPPTWTSVLTYCAPNGTKQNEGSDHLPAGCVTTDLLVGQKALDLGQLSGETLTVNGKQAIKQIDTQPPNVLVSRIYTLVVYGTDGTALFGFSSMIGAGTDKATQEAITATLDQIATTVQVDK